MVLHAADQGKERRIAFLGIRLAARYDDEVATERTRHNSFGKEEINHLFFDTEGSQFGTDSKI